MSETGSTEGRVLELTPFDLDDDGVSLGIQREEVKPVIYFRYRHLSANKQETLAENGRVSGYPALQLLLQQMLFAEATSGDPLRSFFCDSPNWHPHVFLFFCLVS